MWPELVYGSGQIHSTCIYKRNQKGVKMGKERRDKDLGRDK